MTVLWARESLTSTTSHLVGHQSLPLSGFPLLSHLEHLLKPPFQVRKMVLPYRKDPSEVRVYKSSDSSVGASKDALEVLSLCPKPRNSRCL